MWHPPRTLKGNTDCTGTRYTQVDVDESEGSALLRWGRKQASGACPQDPTWGTALVVWQEVVRRSCTLTRRTEGGHRCGSLAAGSLRIRESHHLRWAGTQRQGTYATRHDACASRSGDTYRGCWLQHIQPSARLTGLWLSAGHVQLAAVVRGNYVHLISAEDDFGDVQSSCQGAARSSRTLEKH